MVIFNMAGHDATNKNTTVFNDNDVRAEFNADYGLTSFGKGGGTDFTEGYQYVMINFFYKKGIGIMCQAICSMILNLQGRQNFFNNFTHSNTNRV